MSSLPTQAEIKRVVEAARASGMLVKRIEVSRDGRIAVCSEAGPETPKSALDGWLEANAG